jgi:calcineurin-like phosphoesterase family protein
MRFFTSDTHFGHQNIMKYEPKTRPFHGTEEMDEVMIERWNAVVGPDDLVFHLGDVAMGDIHKSIAKVGRLNGHKILVPGNHDRVFSGVKEGMQKRFEPEYLAVFDQILPEQQTLELQNGFEVLLCHFPYEGDSHGADRYADKRPDDTGLPLIHGHVHSTWKFNGRQFNVGVDANGLTPVSEDDVIDWIQTL